MIVPIIPLIILPMHLDLIRKIKNYAGASEYISQQRQCSFELEYKWRFLGIRTSIAPLEVRLKALKYLPRLGKLLKSNNFEK